MRRREDGLNLRNECRDRPRPATDHAKCAHRDEGNADEGNTDERVKSAADESAQTENEDPQPQVVLALGLRMTNCAPSTLSL